MAIAAEMGIPMEETDESVGNTKTENERKKIRKNMTRLR